MTLPKILLCPLIQTRIRTMTAQEAIKLVDAALENHWLNLHVGTGIVSRFVEDQKDADEFEAALGLVKVVAK